MIQLMTFEEFESKTQINIKTLAPELLLIAGEIMFKIDDGVYGSSFTRAIQTKDQEKELDEIKQFYVSGAGTRRYNKFAKPSTDFTIVHERLATKGNGFISWTYYKLVVFSTIDIQKIKKLLKVTKLKVFL